MAKWLILILMAIVTATFAGATVQCEISSDNASWVEINSTTYGGEINEHNGTAYVHNVNDSTLYHFRCKDADTDWQYKNHRTKQGVQSVMGALAITVFILVVAGVFFALPFFVKRFARNEYLDMILRRCCWLLAIFIMTLNSAIMATIANSAGLPLTDEMFRFMWIFGWAGYAFMMYLGVKTLFDTLELWQFNKRKKRMGEE